MYLAFDQIGSMWQTLGSQRTMLATVSTSCSSESLDDPLPLEWRPSGRCFKIGISAMASWIVLDSLTPSLFAPDSQTKGFKLRTSAARVRAIIPWVHEASQMLFSPLDPVQGAARAASECLFKVYETLRESSFNHVSVACDQSTRFALLYLALHDHLNPDNNRAFRLKPKMHMFLHMCSDGSRPARFWCYRDEEFGGAVAGRARRRGGMRSVSATGRNVLERFWMQQPAFAMR